MKLYKAYLKIIEVNDKRERSVDRVHKVEQDDIHIDIINQNMPHLKYKGYLRLYNDDFDSVVIDLKYKHLDDDSMFYYWLSLIQPAIRDIKIDKILKK